MKIQRWAKYILAPAVALIIAAGAEAQATRTWVSGVGDDANPCSRTAPCKTFAGAISKTASGGIIDVLDPGGFGALTITKPITIEGNGTLASALHSGTNGIVINITTGTNRNVVLRNLLIDGSGTTLGLNGIRFLAGDSLLVENCSIEQVSNAGISFEPTANASLTVNNSVVVQATNFGILSKPALGIISRVSINNTLLARNGTGFRAEDNTNAALYNVVSSNNNVHGIWAFSAAGSVNVFVGGSTVSHNGSNGLRAEGGSAAMRVSDTSVISNVGSNLNAVSSGQIISFQNNRVFPSVAFTSTLTEQ